MQDPVLQKVFHYIWPILLIAFIVYRRTKRSIGFQKWSPTRLWLRIVIFGMLGVMFVGFGFMHPVSFIADAIGLVCGIVLAVLAVRHSIMEKREQGWFYRTHKWIEATVLVLFLSRVAYRIVYMLNGSATTGDNGAAQAMQPSQLTSDPLTSGVFFILIAYYIYYYIYLLRQGKRLNAA